MKPERIYLPPIISAFIDCGIGFFLRVFGLIQTKVTDNDLTVGTQAPSPAKRLKNA
jgi:hypothetical protein